jgi:TolB-like protein
MLKRLLYLLVAAMVLCTTTPALAEFKKSKIAVLDFQQNGHFETPDIGKMVAEWFTTSLVETGRFDIIERRLLEQILAEQKIGSSGLVESTSAAKIGKMLGVKTVVTGTVQSFAGTLEINARVINVETGSIISAQKVQAGSANRLTDLVKQISSKIIKGFPLEGYVVQRKKDAIVIDLGRQAGVQEGMGFSVFVEGAPIKHPLTGEILDIEKVEKGVVEILEVREKSSHGRIVQEVSPGAIMSAQLVRVQGDQPIVPPPVPDALSPVPDPPIPIPVTESPFPGHDRDSHVLSSHTGSIKAIAFSESGRLAASAGNDETIVLWDSTKWRPLATLRGHHNNVKTVRFSRDARYLASGGSDETLIIWDVQQQRELHQLKVGHTINTVAFSPDGKLVAAGSKCDEIYVWDLQSGTKVRTFEGKDDVYALAFSPNGKILAAGGNNRLLQLWDMESGSLIRNLEGHRRDVGAVAFNKAGNQLISGSNDNRIIYWDVATGTQLRVLEGHRDSVRALSLNGDGSRLVSGDGHKEGGIIVWNAQNSQQLKRLNSDDDFDALALSPDGCTLLVGCDKNLVVRRIQ